VGRSVPLFCDAGHCAQHVARKQPFNDGCFFYHVVAAIPLNGKLIKEGHLIVSFDRVKYFSMWAVVDTGEAFARS
jgi:hypothetical protein